MHTLLTFQRTDAINWVTGKVSEQKNSAQK